MATQDIGQMLQTMNEMQDAHNRQVHPDWREQGYDYYRAIWVECAELLDHYGWKWWKHQTPDIDQVKLEIVDIWHFGLSDMLRANTPDEQVVRQLILAEKVGDDRDVISEPEHLRAAVESLAQETLQTRSFALASFVRVMQALPLPVDELFQLYIGKNVLNHFRQDHGYQSGEYVKVWNGREDNEHLIDLLAETHVPAKELPERLYSDLAERYAGVA